MRSAKLRKVGALILVTMVASVLGAVTFARAACTFTLTAVPAARTDRGVGVAPDTSVDLQASCLHDAFGNLINGQTLHFFVTAPGGSETEVGTDVTGPTTTEPSKPSGSAHFTYGGGSTLSTYGSYGAKAVYNPAVNASTTFSVNSGVATGSMTGSVPVGTHSAGAPLALTATGIRDITPKPISNGTTVTFAVTGPGGFAKTLTALSTGVTTSTDTASATATLSGADLAKSGSYSFTATAGGAPALAGPPAVAATPQATTGAVPFSVASGAVASVKVAVSPIAVIVGPTSTFNVQANSAIDANSNPANDQMVVLRITDPSSVNTDSAPQTIVPLASATPTGTGSGANYAFPASAANIPYGSYSAKAIAGAVSSLPLAFSVQPGPVTAVSPLTLSASVIAGGSLTVSVSGITANGYAAKNGTIVKLERSSGIGPTFTYTTIAPNQLVSGVTKGDDVAGVTFTIPGSANTVAGDYTLKATVEGVSVTKPYKIEPGNAVGDLTVSAPDAAQFTDGSVSIGNVPSTVSTLEVTITKPNNGGTILRSFPATAGTTAISIAAADLNAGLGNYLLQVNGNDSTSSLVSVGSGVLKVVATLPDTIDVTVSQATILPTGSNTITATATKNPSVPVAGRVLDITVSNSLGQVAYHTTRTTDATGKVSVSVFGAQTLAPGPYSVVVFDVGLPSVSGTSSFVV